jgi:uncharacterized OsmC-like protein
MTAPAPARESAPITNSRVSAPATDARESAPQIKTVRAEGRWQGGYRTDVAVRDFGFITAEPEKIGGGNEGPTPMEYVVGALNGCLGVVIELVAKERGIALRGIEVKSAGLVDQRGVFGTAEVSPHFQSVEVEVRLDTDAAPSALALLQRDVVRRCPVYNLIRDSGARIGIDWRLGTGEAR